MKNIKPFTFSRAINGVQVKPLEESGQRVRIRYNGLLPALGSTAIVMHYGFGQSDRWSDVDNADLEKTPEGWESTIVLKNNKQLNFCFRDSAFNWDNNSGHNWVYRIT